MQAWTKEKMPENEYTLLLGYIRQGSQDAMEKQSPVYRALFFFLFEKFQGRCWYVLFMKKDEVKKYLQDLSCISEIHTRTQNGSQVPRMVFFFL